MASNQALLAGRDAMHEKIEERNDALYDLVINQGWIPAQAAKHFGITRERARQILLKYGVIPNELRMERKQRAIAARLAQGPQLRYCKFCGEEYHLEGWKAHQSRKRHSPNPGAAFYEERDRLVAEAYADHSIRVVDIMAEYNISAGIVMRAIERHGVPKRQPSMGRKTHTALEATVVRETAYSLLKANVSIQEIAAQMGVSEAMVYLWRKQLYGEQPPNYRSEVSRAQMIARWNAWRRGEGPRPGGPRKPRR